MKQLIKTNRLAIEFYGLMAVNLSVMIIAVVSFQSLSTLVN